MAVLMTIPQLLSGATAAALHGKHTHHQYDGEGIDDTAEIGFNDYIEQYSSQTLPKRTRLHKRHSENLYIRQILEENAKDLEWLNPCNGVYDSSENDDSFVPQPYFFLKLLRLKLSTEFHNINQTMTLINITDLSPWGELKRFYSFLPKIKKSSRINLKTWYRGTQTYIASFARLGRMQYKFDNATQMHSSGLTHELNDLSLSARRVLCEIETTINGSYPMLESRKKLSSFTREVMNERIKFVTTERTSHRHKHMLLEPEMIDLQFVKFKYFNFLRRMWRVIYRRTKRSGKNQSQMPIYMESTESSHPLITEIISTSEENNLSASYADSSSSSDSRSSAGDSLELGAEYGSRIGKGLQQKRQRKSAELLN